MEIGYDGTRLAGEGEIERSAHRIPRADARARRAPPRCCIPHRATRGPDQRILPIGQTELGTMMHTVYDEHLRRTGIRSLCRVLSGVIGDKTVLMMANHVAVVGKGRWPRCTTGAHVERVAQVLMVPTAVELLPQDVG